eukprot:2755856-Pyramimonas_sp.AAC.1
MADGRARSTPPAGSRCVHIVSDSRIRGHNDAKGDHALQKAEPLTARPHACKGVADPRQSAVQ